MDYVSSKENYVGESKRNIATRCSAVEPSFKKGSLMKI